MSRKIPRSEAILASAGFGKTYQLALRYIRLLAAGSSPAGICAVTFSRKAAGEIFDTIVECLRKAASDPGNAAATSKNIGIPGLKPDDFLKILRNFLTELHRNHIGTLDSFTVSVIRAFPMELGINPDLQLMDNKGSAARIIRHQILARIFNDRFVSGKVREDFHRAFKEATFGRQEKRAFEALDSFIEQYWEQYQLLPDPKAWGSAEKIWPNGCEWLSNGANVAAAADELKELLQHRTYPHSRILEGLLESINLMAEHSITSSWQTSHQKTLIEALASAPDVPGAEQITIKYYGKEVIFNLHESELWQVLLRNLIGTEIERSLQESSGIARILNHYDKLYDPVVRSGRMTFADTQHLLSGANREHSGLLVSRKQGMEGRLYIDYRLDCALDHWLIDEFQDTSDLQWNVIRNLIDEVMQDDSGSRSFFYVGDVKQAIHGWRGGNAALFAKVRNLYSIPEVKLPLSYRSCRTVLDTVNTIFETLPDTVSADVRDAWKPIWVHHEPEPSAVPATGHTALLAANPTGDKGKCMPEDRYNAVARLINEMNALKKDLSVAVLVRSNEAGRQLVNLLRDRCRNTPICHEGRARIVDNPVVGALLALINFAAHPGNFLAWRHVQMSPFGKYLSDNSLDREKLPLILLREINLKGFEELVRTWGARLELKAKDNFGRKRITDLAGAAAAFDQMGSRDCGEFLDYVADHEVEESGSERTVRVMTIHKSKGLTFDMVIVPDLESAESSKVDLVMPRKADTNDPLWTVKLPRKFIAERDQVLRKIREQALEADEFEELCVLYVATTRARYATYMIVDPAGRDTSAASLLKRQLAAGGRTFPPLFLDGEKFECFHENGDRNWLDSIKPQRHGPAKVPGRLPSSFAEKQSQRKRLFRVEPSRKAVHKRNASVIFHPRSRDILDFGSAIHELFSRVGWCDSWLDVEKIISDWTPGQNCEKQVYEDVCRQFRNNLKSPEVRGALARPAGNIELWREKSFDVVINGKWISGVFDRVVIERNDKGKALSAVIIDYKSNQIRESDMSATAESYRQQMELYSSALSNLLKISGKNIMLKLLFTVPAKVYEVM